MAICAVSQSVISWLWRYRQLYGPISYSNMLVDTLGAKVAKYDIRGQIKHNSQDVIITK